jgi:hypothetical protein
MGPTTPFGSRPRLHPRHQNNRTSMMVTLLGTSGEAVGAGRRAPCVALLRGKDVWLFDAGEDTQRVVSELDHMRPSKVCGGAGRGAGAPGRGGRLFDAGEDTQRVVSELDHMRPSKVGGGAEGAGGARGRARGGAWLRVPWHRSAAPALAQRLPCALRPVANPPPPPPPTPPTSGVPHFRVLPARRARARPARPHLHRRLGARARARGGRHPGARVRPTRHGRVPGIHLRGARPAGERVLQGPGREARGARWIAFKAAAGVD